MNPSQSLSKILTDYGRNILKDTRKVEAMLRDLCHAPEHKREINLIILALKENIPNELIHAQPINDMLVMRLIKKLDDAYFIPAQQAQAAIETWAKALNVVLPTIVIQKSLNITSPKTVTQNVVLQTSIPKIITPTRIQPNNELDKGVWTDPNTGLMWARISIGQKWENGQCVGDAQRLSWEGAKLSCQKINLAGYNDWVFGWYFSNTLDVSLNFIWRVCFDSGRWYTQNHNILSFARPVRNSK